MRFRSTLALAIVVAGVAAACYKDDTTGPQDHKPLARVLLTDSPFPFDSVTHVNVYVVRVDATTNPDTTVQDSGWVTVAAPHKVFDLLSLQQGMTAIVGSGELSAGQYRALRVVLNADSSSVLWSGDVPAVVNWQNWDNSEVTLYALVEAPVAVPQAGVDIVIDFDVGRSFLYNYFGTKTFVLTPWLRAVNAAATGALAGTVTSTLYGPAQALPNANVTVYQGNPAQSITTWSTVATGHSDAQGNYRVAYLRPGTYITRFEQPDIPGLAPQTRSGVTVGVGSTSTLSVQLAADTSGGAGSVFVSGPRSVGVGGALTLQAFVRDSNGQYVASPSVTWASDNTALLALDSTKTLDSSSVAYFGGVQSGWVDVTATSGAHIDTVVVQVIGAPGAVASVSLQPAGDTMAVNDSLVIVAVLRDSAGQTLTGVPISWSVGDSTVASFIDAAGNYSTVRARKTGSTTVQAIAQGKVGQASVVVH
jgi:hypothetical protein